MAYLNPLHQRAATARHYYDNQQQYVDRNRRRRHKIREFLQNFKADVGCSRCPERDPACLDFHHNGDKEECLANAAHQGWSIERIKAEIAKCFVLCANCHRKLHYKNRMAPAAGVEPADTGFGDQAKPTLSPILG